VGVAGLYRSADRKGRHPFRPGKPTGAHPTEPVVEFSHGEGCSITGGYVYRGAALGADYQGRYVFADFVRGRLWSIALVVDPATGDARATGLLEHTSELGGTTQLGNISSFGADADGELFVVSYSRGIVFKLAGPLTPPPTPANPHIVR